MPNSMARARSSAALDVRDAMMKLPGPRYISELKGFAIFVGHQRDFRG